MLNTVSSELDIFNSEWSLFAIRFSLESEEGNWNKARDGAKSEFDLLFFLAKVIGWEWLVINSKNVLSFLQFSENLCFGPTNASNILSLAY